ncbi:hypothetical protein [Absidia glauca]|uniref:Uncharacterized protein n=1 Tax=Absidia glauca TaxID=4829 RepID=A0A168TCK3_ABSGL|nr:hypothetical protein [Absidia glauca]
MHFLGSMETVSAGFLYTVAAFRGPKGGTTEERLVPSKMVIVSFKAFIFYYDGELKYKEDRSEEEKLLHC